MARKEECAGTLKRLLAFIIDILAVDLVLLYPFNRVFIGFSDAMALAEYLSGQFYLVFSITLIFVLYFTLFEYKFGQTIGKMIVRQRSISVSGEMKLWQALVRNIFLIPVMPFVFLWVIDPIYILFKKRSLSEIISRTRTTELQ